MRGTGQRVWARHAGWMLMALALLIVAVPARALTPEEVETRVQTITDGLRCPTCQALSVKDSEASFSNEIRDKVRRMVEEGQSDDQIKAYFVARYGEWILREPPKKGIGLVVWLLPLVGLVGAGGLITWSILKRRSEREAAAAAPKLQGTALTAEQRDRIQADLKRYEEEE